MCEGRFLVIEKNAAPAVSDGTRLTRMTEPKSTPTQQRGEQRPDDRAEHVCGALDAVRATEVRRPDLVGEHEVAQRRAKAAAEPRRRTDGDQRREVLRECDGPGTERRDQISERGEAPFPVGVMPGPTPGQLGEAEQQVGEPFHEAECRGAEPDRSEVHRQRGRDHLVADVGEKGREDNAEDTPGDPSACLRGSGHARDPASTRSERGDSTFVGPRPPTRSTIGIGFALAVAAGVIGSREDGDFGGLHHHPFVSVEL